MANERVSSIYDVASIDREQQSVIGNLKQTQAALVDLQKSAGAIELKLGDTKSLIELNTLLKELGAVVDDVKDITLESAKAANELAKAELNLERAQTQKIKTQQADLKLSQQLTAEQNKAAKQAADLTKKTQVLGNEYQALSETHKKLVIDAKNAAVAHGEESEIFKSLAAQVQVTDAQLKRIDATLGQHTRSVGNYNMLGAQFNQLSREMSNIGISLQTTILALSNNITGFAEALMAAIKNGEGFKSIMGSLFTGTNVFILVLNLAVAALVAFGGKLFNTEDQAKKTKTAIDELTSSVDDYVEAMKKQNTAIENEINQGNRQLKRELEIAKAKGDKAKALELEKQIRANDIKDFQSYADKLDKIVKEIQNTNEGQGSLKDRLSPFMSEKDIKDIEKNLKDGVDVVGIYNKKIASLRQDAQDSENEGKADGYRYEKELRDKSEKEWEEYYRKLKEWEEKLHKLRAEAAIQNKNLTEEQVKGAVDAIDRDSRSIFDKLLDKNVLRKKNEELQSLQDTQMAHMIEIEDKFNRGKYKSVEEYEKAKTDLSYKSSIDRLEIEKQSINEQLSLLDPGSSEYIDAVRQINKIELEEYQEKNRKKIEDDKKAAEERRAIEQSLMNAIQQINAIAFDYIKGLNKRALDGKLTSYNREKDAVDRNYQYEVDRIMASKDQSLNKEEAINKARALSEQKRAEIEQKERLSKQRAARFEKQLTINQIIADTALAVVRALGKKPYTYDNIALAIATGAIGAAQLAAAVATPIPTYAKGDPEGKTTGGWAMFGEAGPELIKEPGKSPYMAYGPTVDFLGKGTQIFNQQQMYDLLSPQLAGMLLQRRDRDMGSSMANTISSAIDRGTKQTVRAIKNIKQPKITFNNTDYYQKHVKGR